VLPYTGIAFTYLEYGWFGILPLGDAVRKSKETALKALAMDASASEAHTTLGVIYGMAEYDLESAGREHLQALASSPSNAEAHHHYAHFLVAQGQFDDAISEMEKALELEPLSVNLTACMGDTLYAARRTDEAVQTLEEAIEIDPDYPLQYYFLGKAYLVKGSYGEAITVLETGQGFPSLYTMASSMLGHAHGVSGNKTRAREILDELKTLAESQSVDPVLIGQVHIGLSEFDQALDWLEAGYETNSFHLATVCEPSFDPVRGHPRFVALLAKMGFPNVTDLPSS